MPHFLVPGDIDKYPLSVLYVIEILARNVLNVIAQVVACVVLDLLEIFVFNLDNLDFMFKVLELIAL